MPKSKFPKYLSFSLLVSIIFTGLDSLIHIFVPYFEIISYKYNFLSFLNIPLVFPYAIGKFISTIIMLIILLYIFSKMKSYWKYNIMAFIIVVILEIRYMFDPYYSMLWHTFNLIIHYIFLIAGIHIAKLIIGNSKKVY